MVVVEQTPYDFEALKPALYDRVTSPSLLSSATLAQDYLLKIATRPRFWRA